ncbi:hypothetical protein QBC39DRAFT_301876 [Podospora conica]|nr:hypothetical protein QBC39DRAFT_301876 [Schizothecium conicum]
MGQVNTSLSRRASRRRKPEATGLSPQRSPFLELPVDIILYIVREHLPATSAVSLSLTCRSLLALISRQAMTALSTSLLDRKTFLLLLKKDLGHSEYYFCHTHCTLHTFSGSRYAVVSPTNKLSRDDCRRRHLVELCGCPPEICYLHIRLARNRHFHGTPNGTPLDRYQLEPSSHAPPYFKEEWSARVIYSHLYLSCKRTICGEGMTERELRRAFDKITHTICIHAATTKLVSRCVRALHAEASTPTWTEPEQHITPSQDLVSCSQCLTDYEPAIERRWMIAGGMGSSGIQAYWHVTITSYHRLGGGRSPMHSASSANRFWDSTRDMDAHPAGGVRSVWRMAVYLERMGIA